MNYLRYKLLCWAIICILNLPVFLLGADKKALVLNGIDVLVEENYKSLEGKELDFLQIIQAGIKRETQLLICSLMLRKLN